MTLSRIELSSRDRLEERSSQDKPDSTLLVADTQLRRQPRLRFDLSHHARRKLFDPRLRPALGSKFDRPRQRVRIAQAPRHKT
jgi:hypothetical protein